MTSSDVGAVALDRLLRERLVAPLSPGFASPLDLPVMREDRAAPLMGYVPAHTVVSGVAGLWIHAGGPRPTGLDLVGVRGLHRAPPGTHPPGWTSRFHSGKAAAEPTLTVAGVRVAGPIRCLVDGLRWGNLAEAIPAAIHAIASGLVTREEAARGVLAENTRSPGSARLASAWAAIDQSLG